MSSSSTEEEVSPASTVTPTPVVVQDTSHDVDPSAAAEAARQDLPQYTGDPYVIELDLEFLGDSLPIRQLRELNRILLFILGPSTSELQNIRWARLTIESLIGSITELQEKCKYLYSRLEYLEREHARLQGDLKSAQGESSISGAHILQLHESNKQLNTQWKESERKRSEVESQNQWLKAEIERLTSKIEATNSISHEVALEADTERLGQERSRQEASPLGLQSSSESWAGKGVKRSRTET